MRAVRAALPGSTRAIHRALVTVKAATGTLPTASAQASGPPSSAMRSSASGAERVSFQSSAGPHDLAVLVQRDHPVLLPRDAQR